MDKMGSVGSWRVLILAGTTGAPATVGRGEECFLIRNVLYEETVILARVGLQECENIWDHISKGRFGNTVKVALVFKWNSFTLQ